MTEQERKKKKHERYKEHYAAHSEIERARIEKYRAAHPEKVREQRQRSEAKYPGKKRKANRRSSANCRHTALCMIAHSDKPCCVRCGCDDARFLEINHKNGGGTREQKETGISGASFNSAIVTGKRSIDDLEILCKPCNSIHYLEMKYGRIPLATVYYGEWDGALCL